VAERVISNRRMRQLLLWLNGLTPAGEAEPLPHPGKATGLPWALAMVRRLGFVQVDAISAVERPQYQILFTRSARFRQKHLNRLIESERALFENWTHDAAILPADLFGYWKHYCRRAGEFRAQPGYSRYFAPVKPPDMAHVLKQIRARGPLGPREVESRRVKWNDPYFSGASVAKLSMELLWRCGKLAVSSRRGREKVYDLIERVIPQEQRGLTVSRAGYLDWICRAALLRLGCGSAAQIARFFDGCSRDEADGWCRKQLGNDLTSVRVQRADGTSGATKYALTSLLDRGEPIPRANGMRLLNPFDPLIHDRQRTLRLFGFDYKVEIWVPPAKRRYGYYVLPILEGSRFTGRTDIKVDRKNGRLNVLGLWWEKGVPATGSRLARLDRQLHRLAAFVGATEVRR